MIKIRGFIIQTAIFVILTIVPGQNILKARANQQELELKVGQSNQQEIIGGQTHVYQIRLSAGDYLHAVVDQRGIDVSMKVIGPYGQQLLEVDSPNGVFGPEPVWLIATVTGNYKLRVIALDRTAPARRYQIRIEGLRRATPDDEHQIAAQKALAEGLHLSSKGTREAIQQAIEKCTEALSHWQAVKNHERRILTLIRIAVYHSNLGKPQSGLDYINQALTLIHSTGDRTYEGYVFDLLSSVSYSLGELQQSLDYANQGLAIARAAGDRNQEAFLLRDLATVFFSLGELQQALGHYTQALSIFRTTGEKVGEVLLLRDIGRVYRALGELSRAVNYLNQALQLTDSYDGKASTLQELGFVWFSSGELKRAIDYSNRALALRRQSGNRRGEAYILNNLGTAYQLLGERQRAIELHLQALALTRAIGDRLGEAYTLTALGEDHLQLSKPKLAIDYYYQALSIFRTSGERYAGGRILYNLARAELDLGRFDVALAYAEEGYKLLESLRGKVISPELRTSFSASNAQYYNYRTHIDILMQMHQQRPTAGFAATAFQFSERIRARSLLELLAEARANIRQGVDTQLLDRERILRSTINAKAERQVRLLNSKQTEAQATDIQREIDSLTAEYQDLQAQIRTSSPRYAALTQPALLSLSELQQQVLDQDTLLLEYALGEKQSYLWAVTSQSITSFTLPKRAEIEAQAKRVYELLTARGKRIPGEKPKQRLIRTARADAQFPAAAAKLSEMVLGPVAGQLGAKRLLIVADGALHYIPFAALPLPGAKSHDPLITNYEVVNLPSVSVLLELRRNAASRSQAPKTLAVFADPVFTRDDSRVRAQAQKNASLPIVSSQEATDLFLVNEKLTRSARESGLEFARLPASRQEAAAAAAFVPANERRQAFDFEANRAMALSEELGHYRLLHFATHGLLNSEHPELSGLVFSLVDEAGREQDGFMRLQDIYNLNLSADLVVLSACQTALGKEVRGEGLIGLTRGFMYAGATRVMASLWQVDDQATAELMGEFYREMLGEKRLPAAVALRRAQLTIRRQWVPPYYWAGFILQGEWH